MECIKSSKFTCRAFSFRYGAKSPDGVIDNCQLSDWPVRDMDKDRHLVLDPAFDIFERASYGRGCEIQPIIDDKHKKCVLSQTVRCEVLKLIFFSWQCATSGMDRRVSCYRQLSKK